jgi:amylosucrase
VDVLRLDAVAFLWKKLGTTCQNERKAHLILQLMKDCCQVTAPGVLFIAEAIVAPTEVTKYFGEDAIVAKECEIAYNATLMSLLWDSVATRNTRLLSQGLKNLPKKLERATWLNYVRCHDDIGFGFDDSDIEQVGFDPREHRRFLIDYFKGDFDSIPRGLTFMPNDTTGDARICGSLASLVGLETAIESKDTKLIATAINRILLMHAIILSFGGIPLIYNGDAIGVLNDYSFFTDPSKCNDTRWVHRPKIDWAKAELRWKLGTVEHSIFTALKRMISIRKEVPAFADFNNRDILHLENDYLLAFVRFNHVRPSELVLVVANFNDEPRFFDLDWLVPSVFGTHDVLVDLHTGRRPAQSGSRIVLQAYQFYWLTKAEVSPGEIGTFIAAAP